MLCIRNEVATTTSLDVKKILLKFVVIDLLAHVSPVRVLEALKFAVELCFKFKVRNFVCNWWQRGSKDVVRSMLIHLRRETCVVK